MSIVSNSVFCSKKRLTTRVGSQGGSSCSPFPIGAHPFGGATREPGEGIAEIDRFNASQPRGVRAKPASITWTSPPKPVPTRGPDFIAPDGLHPSGKMYAGYGPALLLALSDT